MPFMSFMLFFSITPFHIIIIDISGIKLLDLLSTLSAEYNLPNLEVIPPNRMTSPRGYSVWDLILSNLYLYYCFSIITPYLRVFY